MVEVDIRATAINQLARRLVTVATMPQQCPLTPPLQSISSSTSINDSTAVISAPTTVKLTANRISAIPSRRWPTRHDRLEADAAGVEFLA